MSLQKSDILGVEDLAPILVPVPEWGGDVYVLPCSGDDLDWWDQYRTDRVFGDDDKKQEPDWRGLRAGLVARQLCDEQGSRQGWTELEVLALAKKHGGTLNRIYQAIQRASGLKGDAVEQAEKNSPGTQPGNSS